MPAAIIIFGAAVRSDGGPSPSLHRRTLYGLEAARSLPDAPVFCSGGKAQNGRSEASVMREILLAKGVAPDRLELDEESQDTLQNVIAAAYFIRAQKLDGAVICTDDYHAPRVSMLFRGLGVSTELGPIGNDLRTKDFAAWSLAAAREVAAYAYDFAVISHRRPSLLRMISQG